MHCSAFRCDYCIDHFSAHVEEGQWAWSVACNRRYRKRFLCLRNAMYATRRDFFIYGFTYRLTDVPEADRGGAQAKLISSPQLKRGSSTLYLPAATAHVTVACRALSRLSFQPQTSSYYLRALTISTRRPRPTFTPATTAPQHIHHPA